jgi:hypothetical protein
MGIPAYFREVDRLPRLPVDLPRVPGSTVTDHNRRVLDERIFRVVCKYLNSGFPVIVLTEADRGNHAFTLVGWKTGEDGRVVLIACDDRLGPYEEIASPTRDGEARGAWKGLMLPLPGKVFLSGEAAEARARGIVAAEFDHAQDEDDAMASDLAQIAPRLGDPEAGVSVRSRLIEGRRYKVMTQRQDRDPEGARIARMAHLPHWVWVVEFQDRECRDSGAPCVLAEIVFDSTSHDERPTVDLISAPTVALDLDMIGPDVYELPAVDADPCPPWLAWLDGRKWRSLISDPAVSDREYDSDTSGAGPPGSVGASVVTQ